VLLVMACCAKRNQVFVLIATELAATPKMMYLQFGRRTTHLTTPTVALQYFTSECGVLFRNQLQTGLFQIQIGDSFHRFQSGPRDASASRSRLAPAKKSAQTISRQ